MKRTVLLLACVIAIVFLNAQTLVNDEYTGALEVIPSVDATCRSTTSGTTIGATQSMPDVLEALKMTSGLSLRPHLTVIELL
jgi:hypothetical protein